MHVVDCPRFKRSSLHASLWGMPLSWWHECPLSQGRAQLGLFLCHFVMSAANLPPVKRILLIKWFISGGRIFALSEKA